MKEFTPPCADRCPDFPNVHQAFICTTMAKLLVAGGAAGYFEKSACPMSVTFMIAQGQTEFDEGLRKSLGISPTEFGFVID